MNEIFLVYENSDKTEGRGPMRLVPNSGFFTSEDEAWAFADTICGVMGSKPSSGSWRNEKYPQVRVERIVRHNSEIHKKIYELQTKISHHQTELVNLQTELRGLQ